MMRYLADFTMLTDHGLPLVSVKGAIDANNVLAFKAVVECANATGAPAIIVMLGTTEYVCARAYGILAAAYGRLANDNRRLLVACHPDSYPRRMMSLLQLPFPIFDSVAEAVADVVRRNLRIAR